MLDLKEQLEQFTGSEDYHYIPYLPKLHYTDGVQFFANVAQAYWLLDIIVTEILGLDNNRFISIKLDVKGSKAVLTADDGNGVILYTKEIDYTDCPEGKWGFYLIDNILLLPSEY